MLVPLADMLNTEFEENTRWFWCDVKNGFVIETIRDVRKGE